MVCTWDSTVQDTHRIRPKPVRCGLLLSLEARWLDLVAGFLVLQLCWLSEVVFDWSKKFELRKGLCVPCRCRQTVCPNRLGWLSNLRGKWSAMLCQHVLIFSPIGGPVTLIQWAIRTSYSDKISLVQDMFSVRCKTFWRAQRVLEVMKSLSKLDTALSSQLMVRRTIQRLKWAWLLVGSLPTGQEVLNRPMIKGKDCFHWFPLLSHFWVQCWNKRTPEWDVRLACGSNFSITFHVLGSTETLHGVC